MLMKNYSVELCIISIFNSESVKYVLQFLKYNDGIPREKVLWLYNVNFFIVTLITRLCFVMLLSFKLVNLSLDVLPLFTSAKYNKVKFGNENEIDM